MREVALGFGLLAAGLAVAWGTFQVFGIWGLIVLALANLTISFIVWRSR